MVSGALSGYFFLASTGSFDVVPIAKTVERSDTFNEVSGKIRSISRSFPVLSRRLLESRFIQGVEDFDFEDVFLQSGIK